MKKSFLLFFALLSSSIITVATVSASHDSEDSQWDIVVEKQQNKLNEESKQYIQIYLDELEKTGELCELSQSKCIVTKSFDTYIDGLGEKTAKLLIDWQKPYLSKLEALEDSRYSDNDSEYENYHKDYIDVFNQLIAYFEDKQQAQIAIFTKSKNPSIQRFEAAFTIVSIEYLQNRYRAEIFVKGESYKEYKAFQKERKAIDKSSWLDETRRKFYRDNAQYLNETRLSAFTTTDSQLYNLGNILSAETKLSAPAFFSQCKTKNFFSSKGFPFLNNMVCGTTYMQVLKTINKEMSSVNKNKKNCNCDEKSYRLVIKQNLETYKERKNGLLSSNSKQEAMYYNIGFVLASDVLYTNYGVYESLYGDNNNEVYNSIIAVVKPGASSSSSNDTTMSKNERDLLVRGQDKVTPYEKTVLQSELVDTKYLSTAVVNSTTTSCPTLVGEYVKQNTSKKYNEHHFMITNGKIYCVNTAMPGSSYPFYGSVQNYYKDYFYALETKTPAPSKAEVSCMTPRVMYWAGKYKLHLNTETCMWESDMTRTDDELLSYCKTLYPKTTSVKLFAIGESSDSWNSAGGVGYRKMMPSFECVQ